MNRVLNIEQQTHTKPRGWTRVLKIEQQTHTKPVGEPGYLRLSSKPTQNPVGEPGYLWLSNKPTQNPVGQPGYLSLNKIKLVIVDSKNSWVWRYQRGNQNPHSEEEQTTQWPKKMYKRTNNDLQNIHIKRKIEYHVPYWKEGGGWKDILIIYIYLYYNW